MAGVAQVFAYVFKNVVKTYLCVSGVMKPETFLSYLARFIGGGAKGKPSAFRLILRRMRREPYCRK